MATALRSLVALQLGFAIVHATRLADEDEGKLPTKDEVKEISDSDQRCVMELEDSGHGLVCKHDLTADAEPVLCLYCHTVFGSGLAPIQSCMVSTQPYKWLRMEYQEVKIKVSSKRRDRICRSLVHAAESYDKLACRRLQGKRWCVLPSKTTPHSAGAALVKLLNAEMHEKSIGAEKRWAMEDGW
mmetsp:Transcript_37619/g.70164  ORF Transcript_37619/g.70164 Transcript_37619/m.70164 type:complete len:185 (-) Transcript_37619:5-559(-)